MPAMPAMPAVVGAEDVPAVGAAVGAEDVPAAVGAVVGAEDVPAVPAAVAMPVEAGLDVPAQALVLGIDLSDLGLDETPESKAKPERPKAQAAENAVQTARVHEVFPVRTPGTKRKAPAKPEDAPESKRKAPTKPEAPESGPQTNGDMLSEPSSVDAVAGYAVAHKEQMDTLMKSISAEVIEGEGYEMGETAWNKAVQGGCATLTISGEGIQSLLWFCESLAEKNKAFEVKVHQHYKEKCESFCHQANAHYKKQYGEQLAKAGVNVVKSSFFASQRQTERAVLGGQEALLRHLNVLQNGQRVLSNQLKLLEAAEKERQASEANYANLDALFSSPPRKENLSKASSSLTPTRLFQRSGEL